MPFPDAAAITRRLTSRLGETVIFYPVRAASVGAYLGGGASGSSINAVVERRVVLNDEGQAGVENGDVVLMTDSDTAETYSFALRQCSFRWKNRLYDIVRVEDDDPGAVICYTTEFA